jgi:DNA-binding CsgD family transcriptional regulator
MCYTECGGTADSGWAVNSAPVGRDAEVTEIAGFLSAASGAPAALVISGETGIGKTMVWQHVLQGAPQSARVLSCRPVPAEKVLACSALDDLLGDVAEEIMPALTAPSRRALAVALLREPGSGRSPAQPRENDPARPEPRVLARAIMEALRALSRSAPLIVAVDDAQWLDRSSSDMLTFCIRRMQHEPVCILLTSRSSDAGIPLGLDRALPPGQLGRVQLGPLSLGAIGEILRSRLGVVLPRYALTRLYDACAGNPFYALECVRAFQEDLRRPLTHEPIPLPRGLSDLVRHRVRQLTPEVRQVGRLVAASPNPRERLIRAAWDDQESWAAIDLAVDAGLIERDGEMLRFTHPLLRSEVYGQMPLPDRRQVHRRLGAAAEDTEERAWHLALGADRPSERIAGMLDDAARHAESRGAPGEAATLTEQATRLTPAGQPEAVRERAVYAADCYFRAGDITRSRELIQSALAACPAGPLRASLLLRLATIYYRQSGWPLAEETFRQASQEAADDPALCAQAEQELAFARLVAGDLPGASALATSSLRSAGRAGDRRLVAHSLARIALFEFLRGNAVPQDMLPKAEALAASAGEEPGGRLPMLDPVLVAGLVLKWSDRLDEARPKLADRYRHALDRGDEASLPFLLYHFSQLECWAGNWDLAEKYALKACRAADESHQQPMRPAALYSLSLVRAHQGRVQDARELAEEALGLCDATGNVPIVSMVISVLGFLALSLDDYKGAHSHLGRLAIASSAVGLGEPSVLKFLPDEIEALAALGDTELARSLTEQLEARGTLLGRRWALAAAARCRAHLAAVDGDLHGALAACEQALVRHEQLPMPFELGRTMLAKGMIERRAKHKSAARATLGEALGIFEHLGAPQWADKARRELLRITVRASAVGLTEAEHRIAALVTEGKTNREIAAALFITENTTQTHIRHIFQKLGVRSRTELAARLRPDR